MAGASETALARAGKMKPPPIESLWTWPSNRLTICAPVACAAALC
jgi:hypothetical protein